MAYKKDEEGREKKRATNRKWDAKRALENARRRHLHAVRRARSMGLEDYLNAAEKEWE